MELTDVQILNGLPPDLIGGMAEISALIVALSTLKGASRPDADDVASLLPVTLKSAPCFLDRLTGRWRYVFGSPFSGLPDNRVILGPQMFPEVYRLFEVLRCAHLHLAQPKLVTWLNVMGSREKHEDTLFEFAPLLRIDSPFELEYEVAGRKNSTIDWRINIPGRKPLLLEVKNRVGDLFEGLSRLISHSDTADTLPEPAHDVKLLFRSIENKFVPITVSGCVHAVWINTRVRQEESELKLAFEELNPGRIQVAILGDWEDDAYVLSSDDEAKQFVVSLLRLNESRRFVFQRGVPVEFNEQRSRAGQSS